MIQSTAEKPLSSQQDVISQPDVVSVELQDDTSVEPPQDVVSVELQDDISVEPPRQLKRTTLTQKQVLVELVEECGTPITKAAEIVDVNASTARGILRNYKREGGIVHRRCGGDRRSKLNPDVLQCIEEIVEQYPREPLQRLQRRLKERDIVLSVSTIFNALLKLKVTLKKCHYGFERINSAATIASRQAYALYFSGHAPQNKEKCIFVDEKEFFFHQPRTQSNSKAVSNDLTSTSARGRMMTLILAMNNHGVIHRKIVSDEACNSLNFCLFVEELVACLRDRENFDGAWLLMDDEKMQDYDDLQRILYESPYHLKYLPPYSYMLNPAMNVFSKVKTTARKMLSDPMVRPTPFTVIEDSITTVSKQDCANYVLQVMVNMTTAAAGEPFVS